MIVRFEQQTTFQGGNDNSPVKREEWRKKNTLKGTPGNLRKETLTTRSWTSSYKQQYTLFKWWPLFKSVWDKINQQIRRNINNGIPWWCIQDSSQHTSWETISCLFLCLNLWVVVFSVNEQTKFEKINAAKNFPHKFKSETDIW